MKRIFLIPTLILLTACGQGQGAKPQIEVTNAWARPTRGDAPGAVYVSIENKGDGDDRLVSVMTDEAAMAMIHQTELSNGVARMRMAGEINVPAGEHIEMVPGGTHIMLEGLRAPLRTGSSFQMVLKFRESGDEKVTVKVAEPEGL